MMFRLCLDGGKATVMRWLYDGYAMVMRWLGDG